MNSIILKVATKFLLALMILFSLFILMRGHNEPGGGFIAGLITSSAYALYLMAHGPVEARKLLHIDLRYGLALGISCATFSGIIALFKHLPFLTAQWSTILMHSSYVSLGTPLLFDLGVYLVVVSAILMIIFALEEK